MSGTAHAGLAVIALAGTLAVLVVRWALTPPAAGRHRSRRRRQDGEYVPAHHLVPALAAQGSGWPAPAFAHCVGCHAVVPVVVHDGAHRCDAGHITITTGGTL
ncbi:hypothetical protein [Streptomyces antibioticus]|uniref:hypothetical protein n=1 Tax=Streptomyces antibioticus TaxID=1890 RepID=UPI0033F2D104